MVVVVQEKGWKWENEQGQDREIKDKNKERKDKETSAYQSWANGVTKCY